MEIISNFNSISFIGELGQQSVCSGCKSYLYSVNRLTILAAQWHQPLKPFALVLSSTSTVPCRFFKGRK